MIGPLTGMQLHHPAGSLCESHSARR
jgi:hypothetical protein